MKVPNYLLDVIRKKLKEGDVKFVLIRGKKVKEAFETNRLLLRDIIKIFHVSIVSMCKLLCIIIIDLFAVQLVHKSSFCQVQRYLFICSIQVVVVFFCVHMSLKDAFVSCLGHFVNCYLK